jgi:hypothetical protein
MSIVKRIGPASAFRVGLVVYAFLGLILGVICALLAFAGVPFLRVAHLPLGGALVGLLALVLCPILYGLVGSIFAVIVALLYNLAAGWVGGLEIETN